MDGVPIGAYTSVSDSVCHIYSELPRTELAFTLAAQEITLGIGDITKRMQILLGGVRIARR